VSSGAHLLILTQRGEWERPPSHISGIAERCGATGSVIDDMTYDEGHRFTDAIRATAMLWVSGEGWACPRDRFVTIPG
jgi:hypothetical protein